MISISLIQDITKMIRTYINGVIHPIDFLNSIHFVCLFQKMYTTLELLKLEFFFIYKIEILFLKEKFT